MTTSTSSIAWYDDNAADFAARSFGAGMDTDHARFLAHIPAAGAVLEAGCGAGRDALAFLHAGRQVTAFDGSAELARIASANIGLAVRHMTFADMDWQSAFDGVWACATLLHLPRAELPAAFGRIRRALKPGGVFYASFKEGAADRFANGRHFTDLTQSAFERLLGQAGFEVIETWRALDVRPGREGEWWVAGLGRRTT